MEDTCTRNEISRLGKYNLIDKLTENWEKQNTSTVGTVGDDAAVADFGGRQTVFSTKLFLENVHFDLSYFPLKHLGYKCAGIVLSDILGMNAIPAQIVVNIAVSNRFSIEAMEELMSGIRACCHNYKIDLAGLEVNTSMTGMAVSVTAVGEAEADRVVHRFGAKKDELICVSGDFGAAYTGFLLLQREKEIFLKTHVSHPDFEGYEYLLERQLKPEPRIDIVEELKKNDILPTSMTVVSEGIATSLLQICRITDLGCTIFENKTPIDRLTFDTLRGLKIVASTVALNGGEDYELLFTIKQSDYEKVKKMKNVSVIGYMQEKNAGCNFITNDNRQIELRAQGFLRSGE